MNLNAAAANTSTLADRSPLRSLIFNRFVRFLAVLGRSSTRGNLCECRPTHKAR
jgi:hypothetical protein